MKNISIRGARTHNLKNIDLDLPRNQMIVITGLSGSGKSSLAFDTIYAEGQRRYVESLSAYARQFLSMMEKPDIDHIEGLSPAISIEQKSTACCSPAPARPAARNTTSPWKRKPFRKWWTQPADKKLMLLAPVIRDRKGEHILVLDELFTSGFVRVRIDGRLYNLDDLPDLNPKTKHTIEAVVDRFKVRDGLQQRLAVTAWHGWSVSKTMKKPWTCCFPHAFPARCVITHWKSWNPGFFLSTTRTARARGATAWASNSFLTLNALSRPGTCLWLMARFAAGIAAMAITSS